VAAVVFGIVAVQKPATVIVHEPTKQRLAAPLVAVLTG
jgi:hypothetical protein